MTPDLQYKVQAILAEYNALRSEIQSRSDYQNRILQLHITALTVLLGTALSQPLGHLIILLVPLESTIFGLWWYDNAAAIGDIARYIRVSIEGKIGEVLKDPNVMGWERRPLVTHKPLFSRKRTLITTSLVWLTFVAPAIVTLTTTFLLLLTSLNSKPLQQISNIFGINPIYSGSEWWIALIMWLSGLILLTSYFLRRDNPPDNPEGQITTKSKVYSRS